jgi:hypothetical protein
VKRSGATGACIPKPELGNEMHHFTTNNRIAQNRRFICFFIGYLFFHKNHYRIYKKIA